MRTTANNTPLCLFLWCVVVGVVVYVVVLVDKNFWRSVEYCGFLPPNNLKIKNPSNARYTNNKPNNTTNNNSFILGTQTTTPNNTTALTHNN